MGKEEPTHLADQPTDAEELGSHFQALVLRWNRERSPHSSSARLTSHPAYQEIIALGPAVVPLLLQELERAPDHWFRALHALTGADPVPDDSRGKVREMTDAWLRWTREKYGRELKCRSRVIPGRLAAFDL